MQGSMELKLNVDISIELLTAIENMIMDEGQNKTFIQSVGPCEFEEELGHSFDGMIISSDLTNPDMLIKLLNLIQFYAKNEGTIPKAS